MKKLNKVISEHSIANLKIDCCFLIGEIGPIGMPGPFGEKGDRGRMGLTGEKGETGHDGTLFELKIL